MIKKYIKEFILTIRDINDLGDVLMQFYYGFVGWLISCIMLFQFLPTTIAILMSSAFCGLITILVFRKTIQIGIKSREETNRLFKEEAEKKKYWDDCENYKSEHGVYPPKVQYYYDCLNDFVEKFLQDRSRIDGAAEKRLKEEIYNEYKSTKYKKGLKEKLVKKYDTWDHIVDEAIQTKGKGFNINDLILDSKEKQ